MGRLLKYGLAATIAGALSCGALYLVTLRPTTGPEESGASLRAADTSEQPEEPSPAQPTPADRAEIRRQVQAAVENAAPMVRESAARVPGDHALRDYLDSLIARARAQGQITPLEFDVGLAMIAQQGGSMEAQLEFTTKMNALARTLRGEGNQPPPTQDQIADSVDALGDRLTDGELADEPARQAVIRQYVEEASRLAPEQQIAAMQRLNELAGQPARPGDVNRQWSVVESTRGADRQAAIQDLVQAVSQLPPDQQLQHMQRLNQLTRQGGAAAP